MAPVTAAVKENYKDRITFTTLDVENTKERVNITKLWNDYKVTGTPTYIILDAKGKEVGRIVGSGHTVAEFDALLKKAGVPEK